MTEQSGSPAPTSAVPSGDASKRLLLADAFELAEFAIEDVTAPRTVDTLATEVRGAEVGLWQIDAGSAEDIEADEVFLVLAGRGQVGFEDGSVIALRPGVLVQLHAGDVTTWTIEVPLRKLYVAWP